MSALVLLWLLPFTILGLLVAGLTLWVTISGDGPAPLRKHNPDECPACGGPRAQ